MICDMDNFDSPFVSDTHRRKFNRRALLMIGSSVLAGCRNDSGAPTVGPTKPLPTTQPKAGVKDASTLKTVGEKEFAYAMELQEPNGSRRVREDHTFRSRDGFRIWFKAGFPAHVYLLNRGQRESRFRLLFPSPAVSLRNPLRSGEEVVIPNDPKTWMRMDRNSGEENFVIVAATIALVELEKSRGMGRDEVEGILADIQRRYGTQTSRRFEDGDWVKIFAADGGKEMALVLRIPLKHT